MKLFIWEGRGISEAYHDDGLLVVLANDVDEARRLVRQKREDNVAAHAAWDIKRDAYWDTLPMGERSNWSKTEIGKAIWDSLPPYDSTVWDGEGAALDLPPSRVLDVVVPAWVAFCGGGYD